MYVCVFVVACMKKQMRLSGSMYSLSGICVEWIPLSHCPPLKPHSKKTDYIRFTLKQDTCSDYALQFSS